MAAAARQRRNRAVETVVDDIGAECLELTDEYVASLRAMATSLEGVMRRRDCAQVVARYIQYAREVEDIDGVPVGLVEWIHALDEGS